MSNSGGFAVTRTHTEDRFYNPPAVRRQLQLLQQQQLERQQQQQLHRTLQKELWRPLKDESRVNSVDSLAESRMDLDESTLSAAQSSPGVASLTNLDRLMESVTPLVPAQCFSEVFLKKKESLSLNISTEYYNLSFFLLCLAAEKKKKQSKVLDS